MNPTNLFPAPDHHQKTGSGLIRPLGLYGLMVICAWLANQAHEFFFPPFAAICLFLPFLERKSDTGPLKDTLSPRREGWTPAVLLAGLYVLSFHVALWAVVHFYLQALFILPRFETFILLTSEDLLKFIPFAVLEEFFFRGYLQETVLSGSWENRGVGPVHYKNIAVSVLFALAHAASHQSLMMLITFGGSLVLGWLITRSGRSIWPAAALHAFGNASTLWFKATLDVNIPWI